MRDAVTLRFFAGEALVLKVTLGTGWRRPPGGGAGW